MLFHDQGEPFALRDLFEHIEPVPLDDFAHILVLIAQYSRQDRDAVVDSKLRVRGIDNLRVIDGSLMPTVISGNTNLPIMAMAEKAAELIAGK